MRTDFQQIIDSPARAYQEGLRFFMGEGILNETLRRVARDAEKLNPYVREKFLELQKAVEESGE